MTSEGIVAILGAIGTFAGVLALMWRQLTGDRFKRRVDESANILSGYTNQVRALNAQMSEAQTRHAAEMTRLTAQHKAEMDNMGALHDRERGRWQSERDRLEERIDALEGQVTALLMRGGINRPDA